MIAIQLPKAIEEQLRAGIGRDLHEFAREALIVEGYRTGTLSIGQAARLLSTSIDGAYGVMKAHQVPLNYTVEDLEQDLSSLKKLFPEAAL